MSDQRRLVGVILLRVAVLARVEVVDAVERVAGKLKCTTPAFAITRRMLNHPLTVNGEWVPSLVFPAKVSPRSSVTGRFKRVPLRDTSARRPLLGRTRNKPYSLDWRMPGSRRRLGR